MASKSPSLLCRKIHLYFGLFISPALIFFALTGAYQTLGLHESGGTSYKPPAWMATLAQIHKKQTGVMPARRGPEGARPDPARPDAPRRGSAGSEGSRPEGAPDTVRTSKAAAAAVAAPQPVVTLASKQKQHLPLKVFFVLVSVGLLVSTVTGIYMAYKYDRNTVLITALLVLCTAIPIVLVRF